MISPDRASHLAHLIKDELKKNGLIETSDEMQLLTQVKSGINVFVKINGEIDKAARSHITSQKKQILEGTREWDVLYGRFYEQEMAKRGF